MVVAVLCPHCAIGHDEIPSTEEARELQRDLGHLAACSSHLLTVANEHRFHSFVMPYDPAFSDRFIFPASPFRGGDVVKAYRYNNSALPDLIERLINYGQLREHLKFLSIRNFTLRLKAGVTKRRLRLFINTSRNLHIPVPGFLPALLDLPTKTWDDTPLALDVEPYWWREELWIPRDPRQAQENCTKFDVWLIRLLVVGLAPHLERLMIDPIIAQRVFTPEHHPTASLSLVRALGTPQSTGDIISTNSLPICQMHVLLESFPNVRVYENAEQDLSWEPFQRNPADSPPFYPNLRKLFVNVWQPDRLHYVTQVLREFPCLEEFYFHRRNSWLPGRDDPGFSNADVFNAVHHCLRRLTYCSTSIAHFPHPDDYRVAIDSYEEPSFLDVPHFGPFTMLEHLTIDQGLLGRMSTLRDRLSSPVGPHFPDLDWKLPQSLRRLTVRYVYDWPRLAAQFVPLALAKSRGQFPMLSDVSVVTVHECTVIYTGTWPVHIPLSPNHDITRSTGSLWKDIGINFWISAEKIDPPPVEWDDYSNEVETPIIIIVLSDLNKNLQGL